MTRIERPRIYPLRVDGKLVDPMGRPWEPAPRYPGIGPIGRKALQNMKPVPNRTAAAKLYWTAYRAGQEAKREAGIEHKPPGWLGKRKEPKRRQWLPGEHKKPC